MKKKIISLLSIFVLLMGITGCNKTDDKSNNNAGSTVRMNGSTSMEKLVNGLAETYRAKYPNIVIEPQFTGSSAGIESLVDGTTDVATSSRALTDAEKSKGIVENIVALDGIVIAVDKENHIGNLTKEELAKIYSGEINNWKELGGDDHPIVVIGREAGSGTRDAFEGILGIADTSKYAQEIDSTGAVMAKVASIRGAIGYISLDVVDDSINIISVEGVPPNEETIKSGEYLLQRPFIMATQGEIKDQSKDIQNIFEFIYSDEGQKMLTKLGLVGTK